jgi:hypothetical protein
MVKMIKWLWVFMVALNLILFIGQTATDNINPNGVTIYNYNGSFVQSFDKGGYTLDEDSSDLVPDAEGSVSPTTGNFFTDTFSAVKNWFVTSKGGSIINNLFFGVPNLLKAIFPAELGAIAFALSFFWLAISTLSFIMFLRGLS